VNAFHPHGVHDLQETLRAASADGTRVLTVGGRTQIDKGNPTGVDAELWTTFLDRVIAYDPQEMLIVVEAGMRVHDLQAELAANGQEWTIDAPDDATVGGVIASGRDPVRRLRVGAMRDTVVEMTVVTGDGRAITSGARTVKNVTGYDVHRLLTGSLGTLGVIVQVALKVRPLPVLKRTLQTDDGGLALAERLLGAVPLPAAVMALPERVLLRLEGWPGEVDEQTDAARAVVGVSELDPAVFLPTVAAEDPILTECAVVPSRLPDVVAGLTRWAALAGVGTAWVGCADPEELAELRAKTAAAGGIAPVVRGPGGLGDAPLPAIDVHRRLKAAFDPAGILAPGRFWGGL